MPETGGAASGYDPLIRFRKPISAVAWVLLGLGLLLPFPPFGDLLLGK